MSKQRRISAIISIAIVLIAAIASMGYTTADTNVTTTSAHYQYNGNLPPWVDQHSAINMIPTVIADSTLWSTPMKNPYNGNLPPWIDYNVQESPYYDHGPVVLTITGNVNNKLNLSMTRLSAYDNIAVNASYVKGSGLLWYNVTGASLNALLDAAVPGSGATSVTFYGTDGYNKTIPLSTIRGDSRSIIAFSCPPDGSLRNIVPSQNYASAWVKDLCKIVVS